MAKLATGMSTMLWVIGFLSTLAISIYLLNKAVKDISFAAGFATWAGFGALGSLMVGSVLFVNPIDVVRLLFIYALIASITVYVWLLKLCSNQGKKPFPVEA